MIGKFSQEVKIENVSVIKKETIFNRIAQKHSEHALLATDRGQTSIEQL